MKVKERRLDLEGGGVEAGIAGRPPLTHSSQGDEGCRREGRGLGGPGRQEPGIPTISHPTRWPGLSFSHMTHSNRPWGLSAEQDANQHLFITNMSADGAATWPRPQRWNDGPGYVVS